MSKMMRTRAQINPCFRVLLALALAASLLLAPPAQEAKAVNNPFTKEVSPNPAIVGEEVTFTLTLTNAAPSTAYSDGIGDNLPGGVEFVSATVVTPDDPQGIACVYRAEVHYVVCGQHRLDPGESMTATVIVVPLRPGDFINQGQSSTGGVVRTPFTVLPATPEPNPEPPVLPPVIDASGGAGGDGGDATARNTGDVNVENVTQTQANTSNNTINQTGIVQENNAKLTSDQAIAQEK